MNLFSNVALAATGSGDWTSMLLLVGIMVVFVLVMIIPQKQREKKIKAMLEGIKAGNKVRTIGGIYGKVISVDGEKVVIETGNGTQIEFAKGAISTVESSDVEADMGDMK